MVRSLRVHVPAKTMVMGEYALLVGGPGLVMATEPWFSITWSATSTPQACPWHPDSPAALLWRDFPAMVNYACQWSDPVANLGGLGGSGAQYLATWWLAERLHRRCLNRCLRHEDVARCWQDYRAHARFQEGLLPSGADLWAQGLGGLVQVEGHGAHAVPSALPGLRCLVWHQGVSLPTHTHLATLHASACQPLVASSAHVCQAWEGGQEGDFIQGMQAYARALDARGWVSEHARQQLALIRGWPEVLAAKACGAMGAETLMIWTLPHAHASVLERCKRQLSGFLVSACNRLAKSAWVERPSS